MLARRLAEAGHRVSGPLGRGAAPEDVDVVLLAVPDKEIATAARRIPPGPLVGHLRAPPASTPSPATRASACIR